jgi:hypothetical protein
MTGLMPQERLLWIQMVRTCSAVQWVTAALHASAALHAGVACRCLLSCSVLLLLLSQDSQHWVTTFCTRHSAASQLLQLFLHTHCVSVVLNVEFYSTKCGT